MTRTFEVIPAIDLRGGRCVRLLRGDFAAETHSGDDPVAMARRWQDEGATRLHVVDLDGAARGERTQGSVIAAICRALSIPVQVGGGLRTIESIRAVLDAGAERAILGTAAVRDPAVLDAACQLFPGRIVAGIDQRGGRVATEGWLDEEARQDAVAVARRAAAAGCVAIVYTDIERDGTREGAALEATVALAAEQVVPVIVSGGVAGPDDVRRARAEFDRGANLAGVIAGRALYEGDLVLAEAVRLARGEGC